MVSTPDPSIQQRAREAAAELTERFGHRPQVAMLLGTGHSSIAGQLGDVVSVRPADLPAGLRFAQESPLHCGVLEDVRVVVADAPLSPFEGHAVEHVTFPVHVLRAMEYVSEKNIEVNLRDIDRVIGQNAFNSPTVFGFFLPDHE